MNTNGFRTIAYLYIRVSHLIYTIIYRIYKCHINHTKRFWGLMSRWHTPIARWMYDNALKICQIINNMSISCQCQRQRWTQHDKKKWTREVIKKIKCQVWQPYELVQFFNKRASQYQIQGPHAIPGTHKVSHISVASSDSTCCSV